MLAIDQDRSAGTSRLPTLEQAPAKSIAARFFQALRRPSEMIRCGRTPPLDTPLSALCALVLDTETTGLNVRSDRIISAAGFQLEGGQLAGEPSFDVLINPGKPIPPASTAFHGIVDTMVADRGGFASYWPEMHQHFEPGLIIGHQVYFDITLLGREIRRLGAKFQPPAALDTALLYAALHPEHRHRDLTPCCAKLGIEISERHTARGDAAAAGALFLKLVPMLAEHGIHTLGEALAFERAAMLRHVRRWQF